MEYIAKLHDRVVDVMPSIFSTIMPSLSWSSTALIALGDTPRALDVLEAVHPRGPWYSAALRDPVFDKARSTSRFRALIMPDSNPTPGGKSR